jgi:hypothetical protein
VLGSYCVLLVLVGNQHYIMLATDVLRRRLASVMWGSPIGCTFDYVAHLWLPYRLQG